MASDRKTKPANLSETDLHNERMGRNSLQGDDQQSVRNERHAVPDEKKETDSVIESYKKLDKDYRAKKDLGKGRKKTKPNNEAS